MQPVSEFKDSSETLHRVQLWVETFREAVERALPTGTGCRRVVRTAPAALLVLAFGSGCGRPTVQTEALQPTPAPVTNPASGSSSAVVSKTEMVLIPGGRFVMGDKDQVDAPPHPVEISPFYMDKYLVTQELYQKVVGNNPSRWKAGKNPVEQVRWSDAVRFCNQRSELEGLQPCYDLKTWQCNFAANGYRLPTEAEWECACRAGSTTAWFFGDTASKLEAYAWYDQNAGGHPQPVGRKRPNPWGLDDICGDLWEWCNDFYGVDYYKQSPPKDPRGPLTGETKVVRGGAWRFSQENCRSGYRYNESPGYADVCFGYDIYGFRCVRNAPAKPVR